MKFGRRDYEARIIDTANIISNDEPVFLLRAQDRISWKVLKLYQWLAEANGYDATLVEKVGRHVELMKIWRKKKKADL